MSKKIEIPVGGGNYLELDADRILCNEVVLPGERHPRKRRLWVVANEYGVMGAVWADNEQEALDELVDADLGKGILVDADYLAGLTEEERDELAYLGNAGEAADLSNVGLEAVKFDPKREKDLHLLLKFAEARGAGADTLDDL
jgi:hypothetical protein